LEPDHDNLTESDILENRGDLPPGDTQPDPKFLEKNGLINTDQAAREIVKATNDLPFWWTHYKSNKQDQLKTYADNIVDGLVEGKATEFSLPLNTLKSS